jgi:hypothetical protein
MRENYICRNIIYVGDVRGPEKVNDTWVKKMSAGMMDRGFTLLVVYAL